MINANNLALLRVLVTELQLDCSGVYVHEIVADAPFDLLVTLMKLVGSLNKSHPELKSTLIHKVSHMPLSYLMHPGLVWFLYHVLLHTGIDLPFKPNVLVSITTAEL